MLTTHVLLVRSYLFSFAVLVSSHKANHKLFIRKHELKHTKTRNSYFIAVLWVGHCGVLGR
jgi:hypothetical protein